MRNQISDGVMELEPNNPAYAESDKAGWERNPGSRVASYIPHKSGGLPKL
jgi:hypothetical protein